MRWNISQHRVTWGAQGSPVVALHAGERHVADIRFGDQPGQRFVQDPETRFITIELARTEWAMVMDLLRHERAVELDTEASELRFRPT